MSLRLQILIPPLLIIAILTGLVWFTLGQYAAIREQNETIRQWARVTDRFHLAILASQRMEELARRIRTAKDDRDELIFNYLEQSRQFSENVLYPECVDKMAAPTREYFERIEQEVAYHDDLNLEQAWRSLQEMQPRLQELETNFWIQKRAAYFDYYENLQNTGSRLGVVSLTVLVSCVVLGLVLALWSYVVIRRRLAGLSQQAQAICDGDLSVTPPPARLRDEIDVLAACHSRMTERLLTVVATDKVIEGAEEERRRIAMDLHDQTLSALTALSRRVEGLQGGGVDAERVNQLLTAIEETENDIRRIIDDLHPRTLDLLGLEAALRSYLKQRASGEGMPQHFFRCDEGIDALLSPSEGLALYRIVLEAVTNILRHAQASQYEITLRRGDDALLLTIEDNGIGLPTPPRAGRGMVNIRERAKAIGASVEWLPSRFSQGTCLRLTLPRGE